MAREQQIDEQDAAQSFTMQALAGIAGAKPKTMAPPSAEPALKAQSKTDKSISAKKTKSVNPKTRAGVKAKDRTKEDTFVVKRPGRKRTGRNFPFNQTVTPQTAQAFYDVQEQLGVPMGEVLERAVAALQSQLKRKK